MSDTILDMAKQKRAECTELFSRIDVELITIQDCFNSESEMPIYAVKEHATAAMMWAKELVLALKRFHDWIALMPKDTISKK